VIKSRKRTPEELENHPARHQKFTIEWPKSMPEKIKDFWLTTDPRVSKYKTTRIFERCHNRRGILAN